MLFPIKNRLLQNQVQEVRLHNKLGDQNYHEDINKFFKPMTDELKNTSEKITRTLTENSINNNKAIENLNEKILELMDEKRYDSLISNFISGRSI